MQVIGRVNKVKFIGVNEKVDVRVVLSDINILDLRKLSFIGVV